MQHNPVPQPRAVRQVFASFRILWRRSPWSILAAMTRGLGLVLCLQITGCGVAPQNNLVGEWRYTGRLAPFENTEAARTADPAGVPVEIDPAAEESGIDDSGIRLIFGRWGKLTTRTHQGPVHTEKIGSWSWLQFDPASQVGAIQCRLLGQKTDHRVEFLSRDKIRLNPPNLAGLDQELDFERIR